MDRFITKDSGERKQFSTGMQRDTNTNKARFDLLFPKDIPYDKQMLTRFANLLARGAVKYDERNWEKARTVEELNRFKESAARHFNQWLCGETDEDHAVAVWFNIMGAEFVKDMQTRLTIDEIKAKEHIENIPPLNSYDH